MTSFLSFVYVLGGGDSLQLCGVGHQRCYTYIGAGDEVNHMLPISEISIHKDTITETIQFSQRITELFESKQLTTGTVSAQIIKYEIWRSNGGEDVEVVLLGSNAVWNILPPSSVLTIEAECSSETFMSTYESTRRHNTVYQHRQIRQSLKFKCNKFSTCVWTSLLIRRTSKPLNIKIHYRTKYKFKYYSQG
jgi:hypothetical protein